MNEAMLDLGRRAMTARAITPEERDRLAGRQLVVSMSGGKDSTAMALHLREQGLTFEAVFFDTGWEHPATVAYVEDTVERLFGPVTVLRSPGGGMVDWLRTKQMFPSRVRRFCTEQLKSTPIREYLAGLDDPVSAVGIRAAESARRATMPAWEECRWMDATVWRPIIDWTEADVIEIHRRHGVAPNPLYLHGASRVGCFPCIYARKSEVRLVAELWPERVDEIAALEAELSAAAAARAAAAGLEPSATRDARTFFGPGEKGRGWSNYGIRDVVEWAQTGRGGHQFELFDSRPVDDGCGRWGLCEHPSAARDLVVVCEPKP